MLILFILFLTRYFTYDYLSFADISTFSKGGALFFTPISIQNDLEQENFFKSQNQKFY